VLRQCKTLWDDSRLCCVKCAHMSVQIEMSSVSTITITNLDPKGNICPEAFGSETQCMTSAFGNTRVKC
jgi:hypothetical protein